MSLRMIGSWSHDDDIPFKINLDKEYKTITLQEIDSIAVLLNRSEN